MKDDRFHVISLGMGRQSSDLLIRALEGEFNFMPDMAIFSDLQTEPDSVYSFAKSLEEYCLKYYNFHITTIHPGNYLNDITEFIAGSRNRVAMPPLWVDVGRGKEGKLMRQCTVDYKIMAIRRAAKKVMNAVGKKRICFHFGIPMDEIDRAADIMYKKDGSKQSPKYIDYSFPFIQQGNIYTKDCVDNLESRGLKPGKSSCLFCPFHSDAYWLNMKENNPEEWRLACHVDDLVRDWPRMKGDCYLHRSLTPLSEINFNKHHSLFNQPSGFCHAGICGV